MLVDVILSITQTTKCVISYELWKQDFQHSSHGHGSDQHAMWFFLVFSISKQSPKSSQVGPSSIKIIQVSNFDWRNHFQPHTRLREWPVGFVLPILFFLGHWEKTWKKSPVLCRRLQISMFSLFRLINFLRLIYCLQWLIVN